MTVTFSAISCLKLVAVLVAGTDVDMPQTVKRGPKREPQRHFGVNVRPVSPAGPPPRRSIQLLSGLRSVQISIF